VLVLGLGNELMGDDGVGVRAARSLAALAYNVEEVRVREVGTGILNYLSELDWATHVIALDALMLGEAPGSVYELPIEDLYRTQVAGSLHDFAIADALALAAPGRLHAGILIGVEPAFIGFQTQLSPAVEAALPRMVAAAARVIERCRGAREDGQSREEVQ
jgi:hydrogenase maturation protease